MEVRNYQVTYLYIRTTEKQIADEPMPTTSRVPRGTTHYFTFPASKQIPLPAPPPRPRPAKDTMLHSSSLRLSVRALRQHRLASSTVRLYSTADRTSDRIPTNDPSPPAPAPNVSETNAVPSSAAGNQDAPLQEMPEDAERQRVMQAPNRATTWSRSQAPRALAMTGPRFEQTIMHYQVGAT